MKGPTQATVFTDVTDKTEHRTIFQELIPLKAFDDLLMIQTRQEFSDKLKQSCLTLCSHSSGLSRVCAHHYNHTLTHSDDSNHRGDSKLDFDQQLHML